jgi:DhnA family fructose-bisphosphate aldolase class Ia
LIVHIEDLATLRAEKPQRIAEALKGRSRRPLVRDDGRLLIVAADHPARGSLGVGTRPFAMASRKDLLERLALSLQTPGVDGVLGTADIIDDLALMGLLEDKIVVASMNRGGLRNATFEFDDRFTAYTVPQIVDQGLDFAKTLLRVNLDDAGSVATLEKTAHVVDQAAAARLPIMIEPFMSSRVDGKVVNDLSTEAVLLSIAVASGLGSSSASTWLKIPVVSDMERVMEGTTLPTLLLGGDLESDQERTFESWKDALGLPGVRGLVVGRSLLYPEDNDVQGAVTLAAQMVHPGLGD